MSIDIKINKPFPDYQVGQIVTIQVDGDGTPLDYFWRRRLKDAKIDSCCEIVKPATKKVATKQFVATKEEKK